MADFVACGRCSFFLAGYRVIHGKDQLEQAIEASDDEWLTLRWDHNTRQLVQSSYGSRLDIEFYYFDGRCPECQRRFVISGGEGSAEPVGEELPQESQYEGDAPVLDKTQAEEPAWESPEPTTLRMALTTA